MNRLCLEGMCKRVVKLRNEKDVIRIVVSDGFSKDTLNDAVYKIENSKDHTFSLNAQKVVH